MGVKYVKVRKEEVKVRRKKNEIVRSHKIYVKRSRGFDEKKGMKRTRFKKKKHLTSPERVHVRRCGSADARSGRMWSIERNREGTAISLVTRARPRSWTNCSGSLRTEGGTIRMGIPHPRAPKISKIESTKLSDVFEQTSSVCLKGYSDHIH
jgi:hypothetical protein